MIVALLAIVTGVVVTRSSGRSAADTSTSAPSSRAALESGRLSTAPTGAPGATSAPAGGPLQVPADPSPPPRPPGVPVRLTVARVGINTTLQPLGLLADGSLQSPSAWQQAGWYAKGIRPGAVGPAVIAGHVDSVNGPAVFYRLRDLRVGDTISVLDSYGVTRRFIVSDVREYPKSSFPTEAVYGPTVLPVLRLVTCTGDFDFQAHSYLDNLVVSADLAAPTVM